MLILLLSFVKYSLYEFPICYLYLKKQLIFLLSNINNVGQTVKKCYIYCIKCSFYPFGFRREEINVNLLKQLEKI